MAPNYNESQPPRGEPSHTGHTEEDQPTRHERHESHLARIISGIDEADATSRYHVEEGDNKISSPNSSASSDIGPEKKIIHWEENDPENPYNWSFARKCSVVLIGMIIVINSTLGSSLPSNAIPIIVDYFHVDSSVQDVLPISTYLIGYVVGPLGFGPLSESYGRQTIMASTFFVFTVFTMACAVAPNWGSLLAFRFFVGVAASSPIAVIGGIYADIFADPRARGRSMAVFIGGTVIGPLAAPVVSGFIAPALGWRWVFWVGLIFAGASFIPLFFLPETFGPVLLSRRAAKLRKSTGNPNIFAPFELEKKGFKQLATVVLTRPLRMICFELIVLASCIYLSVAYAIFYMFFEAYPIIFQGIYHQSPGISGLMFFPIAAGAAAATAIFLYYDAVLYKARQLNKPWTQKEESRRLPLACLGGPLYVVALFWMGWTARESIPFWVPMLAGIPFGAGFVLIFMALLNYLADAYEIFAASAMAASSCARSLAGATLPFAATPMYNRLGVAWASTLLGFLSLVMCCIPFLFLWKGDRIRAGSKFCNYLKERKILELEELERERQAARLRETGGKEGGELVEEKV